MRAAYFYLGKANRFSPEAFGGTLCAVSQYQTQTIVQTQHAT